MPSRRRLQLYAIIISIFSVFYNAAEGVVSIIFGAESSSRALVFFGIQSAVEVMSALLVTWRFLCVSKSDDDDIENTRVASTRIIRIERVATTTIGASLFFLTIAAIVSSGVSLAAHDYPTTALPSLLVAATTTGLTFLLYIIKRYLARALNSSTLNGEAVCALCCTQLSVVLLIGSLIYRVWEGGWWVDAATAIVISLLFGWEGIKMVRWAQHTDFDGGCCAGCHPKESAAAVPGCVTPSRPSKGAGAEGKDPEENPSPCSSSNQCCGCAKETHFGGESV